MCLVCGADNPFGLYGRFYELTGRDDAAGSGESPAGEGGAAGPELLGLFTPRDEHQSYPGRLHGGVSSAILDETIGRAIRIAHPEEWGVTAEFTIRFRKPVPLDEKIRCVARITRDTSRLFEGTGEIVLADGSVAVSARGKYLKMPLEAIAEGGMDESEWFADPRETPGSVDMESPGATER
jgi:acyl-coenzyme A thioesterase PaaI-like protein